MLRAFTSAALRRPACVLARSYAGKKRPEMRSGPGLRDFLAPSGEVGGKVAVEGERVPYLAAGVGAGRGRKVYIETYGCQMNVSDTEVAWAVLKEAGYTRTPSASEADVILAVTCAIRENAEKKVWSRLDYFRSLKRKRSRDLPPLRVGVLGCMAERLKTKLLETDKMVDVVAGPDSYRDLPRLLSLTHSGQEAVNVMLSLDETYADIMPVRTDPSSPSAFVSIMRGCENMCSFCIVPFTRGRERSRPIRSILEEVKALAEQGVKEVVLLGQNVNSYRDLSAPPSPPSQLPEVSSPPSPPSPPSHPSPGSQTQLSRGFKTIYHSREGGKRFTELLDQVSEVAMEMRVRFTSPHPKDFPDELLHLIQARPNICKHVHLPAQSGSTAVLERMRRGHTREAYLELVGNIRSIIPDVTLSSDFIAGFCGETEEDHEDTLSLMRTVGYDMAFMFAYSMRQKTHAYHRMKDDVPEDVKNRRLREIIATFHSVAGARNQRFVGTEQLVLVEGASKRSALDLTGRTDGNMIVIFPAAPLPPLSGSGQADSPATGDYVTVKITSANSLTLKGTAQARATLQAFSSSQQQQDITPPAMGPAALGL